MEVDLKHGLKRLRKGDKIFREHRETGPAWWFEAPYAIVPAEVSDEMFRRLKRTHELVPAGDGLFSDAPSQSWTARRRPK